MGPTTSRIFQRLAFLLTAVFVPLTFLGFWSPAGAALPIGAVAGEAASPAGAAIIVKNADPERPVRVLVDGLVQIPSLPPGNTSSFVLDEGRHTVSTHPVGAPTLAVNAEVPARNGDRVSFVANATSLTVADKKAAAVRAVAKFGRKLKPVTTRSIIVGTLALAAAAAGTVSQLSILRAKLLDERASLRMAEMSGRSLSSLPPLSMDKLARSRQQPVLRGSDVGG